MKEESFNGNINKEKSLMLLNFTTIWIEHSKGKIPCKGRVFSDSEISPFSKGFLILTSLLLTTAK